MRISAKIDYACRALLELSLHWPNKVPLQINTIGQSQQIPIKFLTQIMLQLKQIGLVQSVRGKKGGYLLSTAPQKIRLSRIIEGMGGIGYSVTENKNHNGGGHIMDGIWNEMDQAVLKAMAGINFETICDRKREQDKAFIFQI